MKKVSLFMMAAFFAVSAGFVSCSEDDTDNPFDEPTIEVRLNSSATNLGEDVTTEELPGTELTYDIRFKMGADKLTKIKITSSIAEKTFTVVDSTLNEGIFTSAKKEADYKYKTNVGKSIETITFSTTDKAGRSVSFVTKIKNKEQKAEGGFVTSTATLMGGQQNAIYGSFYSVDLGKVLTVSAATSQKTYVDFVYYYGANNKASIGAPSNEDVGKISYGTVKTSTWSNANGTKFYNAGVRTESMTVGLWEDAIASLNNSSATQITDLKVNQYVAYKTANNKNGMFKVTAISEASAKGSITIQLIDKQ